MNKKTTLLLTLFIVFIIINGEIIGNIEMDNKTYTKEGFIFAQLTFSSNDTIGFNDIKNSMDNIKRLGLFGKVEIRAIKTDSAFNEYTDIDSININNVNDTIDILILAKESLMLLPVLGFDISPPKYTFELGIAFNNLFRIRHIIELQGKIGTEKEIAFKYHIPIVYSRPYEFFSQLSFTSLNKPVISVKEFHKKIIIGGGYTFNSKIQPRIFLGYDRMSIEDDTISISYTNNLPFNYDEFIIWGIETKFDFRDDIYYPLNGVFGLFKYTHHLNNWNMPINRYFIKMDIRVFKELLYGVFAIRNLLLLQNGTLAYYNNLELEYFENRAIATSELTAFNRYSGTIEYRYSIPFLFKEHEMKGIGAFYTGTMLVAFFDWSYINNSLSQFNIKNISSYRYGPGIGIRIYSNIFNIVGLDVGYDLSKSGTNAIKYNVAIFSWNF